MHVSMSVLLQSRVFSHLGNDGQRRCCQCEVLQNSHQVSGTAAEIISSSVFSVGHFTYCRPYVPPVLKTKVLECKTCDH